MNCASHFDALPVLEKILTGIVGLFTARKKFPRKDPKGESNIIAAAFSPLIPSADDRNCLASYPC